MLIAVIIHTKKNRTVEQLIQKMKAAAVAVVVEVTQMTEAAAVEVMKHQAVAVVQVVVEEHLYLMELM